MTSSDGGSVRRWIRRRLLRLIGFDPPAIDSRVLRLEGEIADLRGGLGRARAASAEHSQQLTAGTAWQQQAQAHLQALQGAFEELRDAAARAQLELRDVMAWREAAEVHLADLQTESERGRLLAARCEEQVAQLVERSSRHETRLAGLEDSITEIAAALASSRLPPAPE